MQNRKIVSGCVRKLAYDIRRINLITSKVTVVSRPYDKVMIKQINRTIFGKLVRS